MAKQAPPSRYRWLCRSSHNDAAAASVFVWMEGGEGGGDGAFEGGCFVAINSVVGGCAMHH